MKKVKKNPEYYDDCFLKLGKYLLIIDEGISLMFFDDKNKLSIIEDNDYINIGTTSIFTHDDININKSNIIKIHADYDFYNTTHINIILPKDFDNLPEVYKLFIIKYVETHVRLSTLLYHNESNSPQNIIYTHIINLLSTCTKEEYNNIVMNIFIPLIENCNKDSKDFKNDKLYKNERYIDKHQIINVFKDVINNIIYIKDEDKKVVLYIRFSEIRNIISKDKEFMIKFHNDSYINEGIKDAFIISDIENKILKIYNNHGTPFRYNVFVKRNGIRTNYKNVVNDYKEVHFFTTHFIIKD